MSSTPTWLLPDDKAQALLRTWGVDYVDTRIARSADEAVVVAKQLGYPVVLKIASPSITHKSDVGGVELDVRSARQVRESYARILGSAQGAYPDAVIAGVSMQRMAPKGVELIIGVSTDQTFGPMVMFGIGGIFVEILEDVAFRIVPLSEADAHAMVREVKGFPLLNGFRGREAVDIPCCEELLLKVSRLVEATPEIEELDLNPVIAYAKGAIVVDTRIVLKHSRQEERR